MAKTCCRQETALVSNWHFDVPHSLPSDQRHSFMRDTQAILAGLLNRDFTTVEIAPYSMIEFARAVEARWPCAQATDQGEARSPTAATGVHCRDRTRSRRRQMARSW